MKEIFNQLQKKVQGPSKETKDAISTTKNWFSDKYESVQVQRNLLSLILIIACVCVGVLALGISYIKSTRSIEPFVIEIEPKTGVATVVTPIDSEVYSENEAIKRYFIWKYVKLREEFYFSLYDLTMAQVSLFSAADVNARYRASANRGNKESPINKYGEGTTRLIELKSLTFLSSAAGGASSGKTQTAQVRFRSVLQGALSDTRDKVAIVTFSFENIALDEQQRRDNPLGFRVADYKVEDELIG